LRSSSESWVCVTDETLAEDQLRPIGFVSVTFGFLLVALGVAQSLHALPPAQFPDRWLEMVGGIFVLAGIGLTAIAGRSGQPSIISDTTRSLAAPNAVFSVKITKSTSGIGEDPAGMVPTALSHLLDASSKSMLAGMIADLDDPTKASSIHIEGADPSQVKEELQKLLSPDTTSGAVAAAGSSTAQTQPEAPPESRLSQVRELDDLHAAGVLSDDQYQAARAKLLG
jgi:uncharacterized protein YjeT (DUF2065 family)